MPLKPEILITGYGGGTLMRIQNEVKYLSKTERTGSGSALEKQVYVLFLFMKKKAKHW